jgi:hypothetical protein
MNKKVWKLKTLVAIWLLFSTQKTEERLNSMYDLSAPWNPFSSVTILSLPRPPASLQLAPWMHSFFRYISVGMKRFKYSHLLATLDKFWHTNRITTIFWDFSKKIIVLFMKTASRELEVVRLAYLGLSRLILAYFLSQNTIHSASRTPS